MPMKSRFELISIKSEYILYISYYIQYIIQYRLPKQPMGSLTILEIGDCDHSLPFFDRQFFQESWLVFLHQTVAPMSPWTSDWDLMHRHGFCFRVSNAQHNGYTT